MNAKKSNLWEESLETGFLAWIEKHGYSEKTRKTYQSMIFAFFTFLEKSSIELKDSNKTVIERFFKERAVSEKTKLGYLWLVSDIFDDMVDCGFLQENNMSIVLDKKRKGMRGKTAKRLPVVLTDNETSQFINYIDTLPRNYSGMRKRCTLLLLMDGGLRAQEMCDLKTTEMHLNEDPPHIRVIGKFNKERIVPLPESIINDLLEFLDMKTKPSQYFSSSMAYGNPYVPSSIYRMVNGALIEAGIVKTKLSPHILRHTYCTRQLANGVPLTTVKQWMGHESIATTAIYEHVVTSLHGSKPLSSRNMIKETV
jgi:site-specific recombinase XerD